MINNVEELHQPEIMLCGTHFFSCEAHHLSAFKVGEKGHYFD